MPKPKMLMMPKIPVRFRYRNKQSKQGESSLIDACFEAGLRGAEARQFMAQCSHECAHFKTMEEYASGADYEGRSDLGNNQPGDGRRFKGRGYIQLTGRANYRTVGRAIGVDLENNPKKAEEPKICRKDSVALLEDSSKGSCQ